MLINTVKPEQIPREDNVIDYESFIAECKERQTLYIKVLNLPTISTYFVINSDGKVDTRQFGYNNTFELFDGGVSIYPVDRMSIKCDTVTFNTCSVAEARNR